MAVCAALTGLLALRVWRAGGNVAGQTALVVAALLAVPACQAALAPGAAVRPVARVFVAAALGLSIAALASRGPVLPRAARGLAAAAALASLHALYQWIWGLDRLRDQVLADPRVPDREIVLGRLEHGRAFAGFSTPAALGGLLVISLPLTVVLAVGARGRARWAWAGLGFLQVAGLLTSSSATAVAALLGALLAGAGARAGRGARRPAWAALGAACLLLVALVALRGDEVLSHSHPNSPWRLRAGNFTAAWSMAADHPWGGVGPGGFAEVYPAYRRAGDNETDHAHNLPLELAAELGWPAGAGVTLLFAWVFAAPALRRSGRKDPLRRAAALGLLAFVLQNVADFNAFLPSLLWIAALLRGTLADGPADEPSGTGPERSVAGASLAVALTACIVCGASGFAADARYAARLAASTGDRAGAESLASRAARWAPWDPEAALALARAAAQNPPLHQTGQPRRVVVLERAESAVRLSPVRAGARATRAEARLALGDLPGALADMELAARLRPGHEPHRRDRDRLRSLMLERIEGARAAP